MQRSLAAPLCAAIITLAACGTATAPTPVPSGPGATVTPTMQPPASAAPTAAATPSATPVPRPSGTLAWPAEFAVELPPGTYFTSPPFVVPMTIAVTEPGWYAGHLNPVFIDLQRFDGIESGSFPTRMLGFGWPENVQGADGPVPVDGLTPAAALDLLAARGSLEPGDRETIELIGLGGEWLDLHSDLANNPLFGTADGNFGLGPELDVRLVALPHAGGLLMLAVLAAADDVDAAWDQALPMLESIQLGD